MTSKSTRTKMDPFTQRMMERARLRREKLDSEMAAVGQSDVKRRRVPLLENNPMDTTPVVSSSAVAPTKEVQKMASPKASPQKPTPVEHVEEEKESNDENAQPHPSTLHSKLNRLGKLYAGPENLESLSSPVHKRTETLSRYEPKTAPNKVTSSARTARLAALARSIEEWEDDLTNIMPTPKKEDAIRKSPVKAAPSVRPISSPAKPTTPVKLPTRALVSSPARSPAPTAVSSPAPSQTSAASPRGVQMGSRALQTNSPVRVTSFVRKATTKTIVWDQSVLASLEAQGFVASKRRSRLVYDFEGRYSSLQEERERRPTPTLEGDIGEEDEDGCSEPASPCTGSVSSPGWVYRAGSPVKPRMGLQSPAKKLQATAQPTTPSPVRPAMVASPVKSAVTPSPAKSPLKRSPSKLANKNMSPGSVLHRAAMFESAVANCSSPTVDPASLPLIQRMALFEKNKSQGPLIPKVAFSTPLPAKLITQSSAQEKAKFAEAPKLKPSDVPKAKFMDMPRPKPAELCNVDTAPPKASVAASAATKVLAQKAMFEQGAQEAPKHTPTVAAALSERQQELEALRSRWDKQKNMANKPHQERIQMDNLRERWARETQQPEKLETPPPPPPMPAATTPSPVKKAEPASSKQYPGLNKVKEIRLSPPKAGRLYPCLSDIEATESEMDPESSSSTSHEASASDVSETSFGDEILQAAGLNRDKTPAKRTANEMTASECAVLNEIDEFLDEALGSDEESYPGPTPPKKSKEPEVDNAVFLKQIIRHPDSDSDSEESSPEREQRAVQRKIQSLHEEVSKQQTVISQASQALNLCRSVAEFSNSQEQVEAERLLLVATHKRQALLHEMQRLKVVGTLQPEHTESGSLTISNLTLPLKREFLSKSRRGYDGK
ncbi:hypothetical protein B566_EDAN017926 [Ephemera danica]|nr:hypothetical protein B566_EDAN017926 [Ephemera danica]